MKKLLLLIGILLLLPFSLKVYGQDYGAGQSLFSDITANSIGDILTVLIVEQSRATSQVETKTDKRTQTSTSGGPGIGRLDFVGAFGLSGDNKNIFKAKGENIRNGTISARMSVTVVDVRDNGDLVIEGTRVIGISNDRETIHVSGVVRLRDIKPDNTIESYLIADAEVSYTGKGHINTGSRPGLITRLVNWIF